MPVDVVVTLPVASAGMPSEASRRSQSAREIIRLSPATSLRSDCAHRSSVASRYETGCVLLQLPPAKRQISAIRNQYERPAGVMPIPQVAFADLGSTKWREGGSPGLVYVADATSGNALAIRTGSAWKVAYLTPP